MITPIVIDPKSVARITGKSPRSSRYLLMKIRSALGKLPHQAITVEEFCLYMGLGRTEIERMIF